MFESVAWEEVAAVHGPAPLAPCPQWSATELLSFAARAPFNAAWLDALQGVRPSELSNGDRLRLVQAWDRQRGGVEAAFIQAAGALEIAHCPAGTHGCPGGERCSHDWSREDLSIALHLAPRTAGALLGDARELTIRSAALLDAVTDGRLPAYAARMIARRLACLDDDTAAVVLDRVLDAVGTRTPGQLDRLTALTIESLRDPAEALAARDRARRTTTGIIPGLPLDDGMASATVTATAEEIAELLAWAARFTVANKAPGETRTVGQRRVDALLAALSARPTTVAAAATAAQPGAPSSGAAPQPTTTRPARPYAAARSTEDTADADATSPTPADRLDVGLGANPDADADAGGQADAGVDRDSEAAAPPAGEEPDQGAAAPDVPAGTRSGVSLRLIMNADTLLGRDDDPAWLSGVGTIPAYLARALAVGPAALQKALVDGIDRRLLALGREHRFPTAELDRYVRARDLQCTFPGCTRPSDNTDLDHITAWNDGGTTDPDNLHPLCRRHHRLKHLGWTPRRNADGTTTWISPAGQTYVTQPARPTATTQRLTSEALNANAADVDATGESAPDVRAPANTRSDRRHGNVNDGDGSYSGCDRRTGNRRRQDRRAGDRIPGGSCDEPRRDRMRRPPPGATQPGAPPGQRGPDRSDQSDELRDFPAGRDDRARPDEQSPVKPPRPPLPADPPF